MNERSPSESALLSLRLLGGFRVAIGGRPVPADLLPPDAPPAEQMTPD